jgi:4-diphosphocytidyl-2-C-methyl-D-erythritol kinase
MQVHRDAVEVVIQAPAKLNLFLEVLAKRADGYHDIETLMCPIDLYDTLYFREEPNGRLELECRCGAMAVGPGRGWLEDVPAGPDNLAWRAVELLRRRAGVHRGANLRLVKRIPTAAGLGGGSSDAAAALVAANLAWNLGLSQAELAASAAELGSDVAFFLHGGPAICRGRGEQVEPVVGLGRLSFVVLRPPEGLATATVYRLCRAAGQPPAVAPLVDAFRRGDGAEAGRLLFNRLQPAAEQLSPWIRRLRHALAAEGLWGHGMSGSGSACFGLCRHAAEARRLARRVRARRMGSVVAVQSCR